MSVVQLKIKRIFNIYLLCIATAIILIVYRSLTLNIDVNKYDLQQLDIGNNSDVIQITEDMLGKSIFIEAKNVNLQMKE